MDDTFSPATEFIVSVLNQTTDVEEYPGRHSMASPCAWRVELQYPVLELLTRHRCGGQHHCGLQPSSPFQGSDRLGDIP